MEKDNNHIKNKVEETLAAFDDVNRASPKPFFYTRLKARMENRVSETVNVPYFPLALRRVLVGMVVILLFLNILTFTQFLIGNTGVENVSDNTNQAIIETYYPATPTLYTLENNLTP